MSVTTTARRIKFAADLHENVPPDWYHRSIKENLLQRYWHTRRFEEVGKLIEPTGGKILDLGSADGVFSKVIYDNSGAEVLGLDVLKSSVDWANKHWKKYPKMRFKVGDAHRLDFKPNTFNAVFALEVLEHVEDPKEVLTNVKKVLKKGGYAVFLVPSDSDLFNLVWWIWTKFRGKIWDHCHIQSFRNNYLPRLAKKVGLKVEVDKKFILGMLHLVKVRK